MRTLSLTYLIGLLLLVSAGLHARDREAVAEAGVLDLRNYNFKSEGPVVLRGEFEFYWNQMLGPGNSSDSSFMDIVEVPGSWTQYRKVNPEIQRYGYATYRLRVLLPDGVQRLSFSISGIYSASNLVINGKAIEYLGFPGMNKYQTLSRYRRPLIHARINKPEAEILFKVSNFDHRLSGIVGKVSMGLPDQMEEMRQRELYRGHFLIGAFIIIGIYFLGLFLIRSERYRLYFALICLMMALRVAILDQVPALDGIMTNGLTAARIDHLNIYFFAAFFTLMVRAIFPFEFPSWAFKSIMWGAAAFILLVVVSPISVFSYTLPWFFVFFLLISGLFIYVVFLAWSRGRSHAPSFTIGLLVLFAGSLNDLLIELDVISGIYLVHYAMFVYLLIYAYIFADKSNQLQQKSDKLGEELSQVRNNLEDLVEERTTELQSVSRQLEQQKAKLEVSNRELVEAINARNRLFSIIGHDVRAPIGYTRQALDMLIENKDISEEERDDLLKMMASSAGITYNLLDNLLVWGRSQTGTLKSSPVSFQLKELVDESLDLVKLGVTDKLLKVEVFVSEEHYVEADRDQLFIVIRNLMSNAMKFTPEKGSIYISSKKQNGEVVISVRDTGIGIPESVREKLFDTRSHLSTNGTMGEKGSGLGLKICHEIIQSNQGWMKMESTPGTGTTILIGIKASREPLK